jgi:hypothetical protein
VTVVTGRLPASGGSLLEILFRPGTSKFRSVNLPWPAGKVKAARDRKPLALERLRFIYFLLLLLLLLS